MSDVFISYAHVDNPGLDDDGQGWVSRFNLVLTKLLSYHLGRSANIWRDPRLEGNELFENAILKALFEAESVVSVVSPRYVQSEWCVREAAEYFRHQQTANRLKVGNRSRLLKVLTQPLELPMQIGGKPLPAEIVNFFNTQLGIEFFVRDPESGRVRVLREEFGREFKELFFQKVDDVACVLAELLKAAAQTAAAPASPPSPGKPVYLALTSHDLAGERERLERELRGRGHTVLPATPLPMVAGELEASLRPLLESAELSVHLVGGRYGLVPEEATESLLELQNRLAAERSASGKLRRLIWTPRDVAATDPRQAAFLKRILEDPATQRGAEVVQDSLEKLKALMLEVLEPPPPPPAPTVAKPVPAAAGEVIPRVYLICDPADETAADPVADFLFDQGFEVSRPESGADEARTLEAHQFNLRTCDAALIYFGQPPRLWVDVKLQDLQRAPGYGRTAPWRATAVCVAPPDHREKQRFRTHFADVLRLDAGFAPEPLLPFVARLKAPAA